MGEVRKLQKKLRQIENLEIKISLTPEEKYKVCTSGKNEPRFAKASLCNAIPEQISRKAELRSRLAELQLQLSGLQQTLGIVGDGNKEKMKRQVENAPETLSSQMPPASKILKGEAESKAAETPAPAARQTAAGGNEGETAGSQDATESAKVSLQSKEESGCSPEELLRQEEAEFSSLKASWEKARFRLRLLEGHNDIVTSVVAVDNLVVSGSRDTTVKVWHVPTATEQKNLGGHTGGVTCLSAPPLEYCRRLARSLSLSDKERFILSGSADCNVKIWALSIGQCVKSVYTFNAVTALSFAPEGDGYIITGSDGGKVQAWSWHTFQNCQSVKAHEEAVTSIQSQGPLVFSGSAEGGVSVWENRRFEREPLKLLHHWSSQVTGLSGRPGGRLTLSPRGDRVVLAYGRASIKILHWRTGVISRLTNHSSITGVTDCVHQTGGVLIGSCYDLANGESSLNLFSLPQFRYLASLTWPDAPRILCFAAWTTGSGDHRWVTGGRDLIVWEQLPSSGKNRGDVTVKRDSLMDTMVLESEGDTEEDEEDEDVNDYKDEGDGAAEEDGSPGSWLRCALQ